MRCPRGLAGVGAGQPAPGKLREESIFFLTQLAPEHISHGSALLLHPHFSRDLPLATEPRQYSTVGYWLLGAGLVNTIIPLTEDQIQVCRSWRSEETLI